MAKQELIVYTTEEKEIIAKVAYRQAQLAGRSDDIPEHELEDAKYYVDMAIAAVAARNSYDLQQYAREYGKTVAIEYVRLFLLGQQPFINPNFLSIYEAWLKAAAQERYSGRPDSWPEYPNVRQRLRNQTYRKFDPDGQTESDF